MMGFLRNGKTGESKWLFAFCIATQPHAQYADKWNKFMGYGYEQAGASYRKEL